MSKSRMDRRIEKYQSSAGAYKIGTTVSTERNWFGLHVIHFPSNGDIQKISSAISGRKGKK